LGSQPNTARPHPIFSLTRGGHGGDGLAPKVLRGLDRGGILLGRYPFGAVLIERLSAAVRAASLAMGWPVSAMVWLPPRSVGGAIRWPVGGWRGVDLRGRRMAVWGSACMHRRIKVVWPCCS
jgi:hypothetical protein